MGKWVYRVNGFGLNGIGFIPNKREGGERERERDRAGERPVALAVGTRRRPPTSGGGRLRWRPTAVGDGARPPPAVWARAHKEERVREQERGKEAGQGLAAASPAGAASPTSPRRQRLRPAGGDTQRTREREGKR